MTPTALQFIRSRVAADLGRPAAGTIAVAVYLVSGAAMLVWGLVMLLSGEGRAGWIVVVVLTVGWSIIEVSARVSGD